MKISLPTLALALLAIASAPLHAQQAWTFDRLLQSTLASHPSMLGRRSQQDAARAEREGAEWARYPTPTVELTTRDASGNNGVARLDQPLWTGGRISGNISAAGSRLDAAGSAIDETALDLTLRVINAAVEALRQKARLQHARNGVDEHERLLGMIKRRVAREVSSQADQRLAESRLSQALNDLSQVKQGFDGALAQLGQLTGRRVSDVSDAGLVVGALPDSIELILQQALDYSPALKRLAHEQQAAGAEVDVRRSAYMPQLGVRLEHATGRNSESRALLVLQAQPGAGLSAASGVQAALARGEAARLAGETARRELEERIALDWNEWQAARSRTDNAEQTRLMTEEVFESWKRQYVIGRKSWIEVLNAVREATQAQFTLEDARASALAAGLRLRAQTGMLVDWKGNNK